MTQLPINQIICDDCLDGMKGWPDQCIQTCVTSPPYWGLRDYGVDGQLGLEKTPEEYVAKMVEIFRGVWRVLRDDGTLWLNLGDTYAQSSTRRNRNGISEEFMRPCREKVAFEGVPTEHGLKPKDLCGIPWRVALALQADGWYLRQDIIWHKPNPMPESVTDRCTKAHDYIFLLTKKPRYFYDAEAIKEDVSGNTNLRASKAVIAGIQEARLQGQNTGESGLTREGKAVVSDGMIKHNTSFDHACCLPVTNRNKRSVWSVTTQPCKEAHFATFPPKLIEPCILAGTSQKGCCPECGAPWERIVEKSGGTIGKSWHSHANDLVEGAGQDAPARVAKMQDGTYSVKTTGWRPTCKHQSCICGPDPIPCIVFDPFMGAGTSAMVAIQNGRNYAGTELSPEYIKIAETRIAAVITGVTVKETRNGQGSLFS